MEDKNYGINWFSLFIKVIVFVVVLLFAIWLVSKIVRGNKGLSFEENNKKFQDASVEYFSKNLPEEGKTSTVTLKQLINWDYLEELKTDGKICDGKNSRSKIELIEDYYSIKSEFVCASKSETTYIKLGNENCKNCDVTIKGLKINKKEQPKEEHNKEKENASDISSKGEISINQNTSNSNTVNNNTINNDISNQIILYEYVKEMNEYSDWYTGKVTGTNIQNSIKKVVYSKFCKIRNLSDCVVDKKDNSGKYVGYKIVDTWYENVDIYRYVKTISEYKYSNAESLEGYTKTGKTKIAS